MTDITSKDEWYGTCDNCSKSSVWHIFMRRAGVGREAASDIQLRELKLCDRCWEYAQPVVMLFGWVVVDVFYLYSENLDG